MWRELAIPIGIVNKIDLVSETSSFFKCLMSAPRVVLTTLQLQANLDNLLTRYSNKSPSCISTLIAVYCFFPITGMAVPEARTEEAGGTGITDHSAIPPAIWVSGLANIARGILML